MEPGARLDALLDQTPSRYVVGIDLGTTNSAVAMVDSQQSPWQVRTFPIRQLAAPGQVEAHRSLPSFHYQAASGELARGAMRLPWSKDEPGYAVGVLARDHGTLSPGRLIASAKSWLCHTGVDRTAELLPWQGAADVERLSPVEVSARYLQHIRSAWDSQHPDEPLARQDIALTLPASFDEVARELTVRAAAQAGLKRVVLIEEPQAAFYSWIYQHREQWDRLVQPGQKILVCDIGGGTSDFTLIRVRRDDDGKVVFHRIAVGDHLILGGDNLDLALARHLEAKLAGDGQLPPRQWAVLVGLCRRIKENLLGPDAPEEMTVTLPGSGSKLIGGGLRVDVTRQEVHHVLVDGFLPPVRLDEPPQTRQSGFQEFGLPFAPDPAITRYLAQFLTAHRHDAVADQPPASDHDPARPDIVLFNGGLFESPVLRARLIDVLGQWFRTGPPDQQWQPTVLEGGQLDLAVARGAAYYGMVRRGEGVRIAAGLARTYYIGVESEEASAVCVVPASAEPGHEIDVPDRQFEVQLSKPVEFPLLVSSTRLTDRPGQVVRVDRQQMTPLPPIRTVLRARRKSDAGPTKVNLHSRLTEIGTVDLWCSQVEGSQSWRIQFDVRSATQTDVQAHEAQGEAEGFVDEASWAACQRLIDDTFGPEGQARPQVLFKSLAAAVEMDRHRWPMSLLRRVWDALMERESGRRRSPVHEARWLNLAGYGLRPGYGLALDDWRVAETWRALQGKVAHHAAACRTESWILWRRIAGGLGAGQQRAVAQPLLASVRSLHRRMSTGHGRGGDVTYSPRESVELWRLLGSLELLDVPLKIELGDMVLDLMAKPKQKPARSALAWTLGRLGARVPVYGPLNRMVPVEVASRWAAALIGQRGPDPADALAVMQLTRRTDDRYRDVPEKMRHQVGAWLEHFDAPPHFAQLVTEGGQLDREDQGRVFGESLPVGLRIV